ncbi:ArsR/SmtB family transcription factor [Carboxylicivirga caseinilyticus]|uniref:ArsR/SmtB family transcription factor n=1 Tax=Carboxylicivirga caseinilyticus TaxID=3417572 RepID=UPI003D34F0E6|nr:helix-turn-helix transcriptional regulator [Marinilabiliaceae bacterium A049]
MAEAKFQLFDDDLQELAQLFKALGHPARLQILKFLASKNACFTGDITEELPLGRTTVNQHLNELKKANLIQGSVQGVKTNYCVNVSEIRKLEALGKDFFDGLNTIECTDC